jgi:hypothetical protein
MLFKAMKRKCNGQFRSTYLPVSSPKLLNGAGEI